MTRSSKRAVALVAAGIASLLSGPAPASDPPVAGLQPDRRPEGAPVVAAAPTDRAQKNQRLKGIGTPWPGKVERIAEQGNWYSPMFAPGMTAPYDLRQLHPSAGKP